MSLAHQLTTAPVITSTANPAVKAAAKLAARKGRRDERAFLVEGPQAVSEALGQLIEVFATPQALDDHAELLRQAAGAGAEVRAVTPEVLRVLADTVTPQGLVGVAPIRDVALVDVLPTARFLVVLDGVSDPGNAGTIIRTADAAGADAVVFLAGSVDPYNPKAVRASTGSVFHLPIVTGAAPEALADLAAAGLQVLAADVRASVPLAEVDLSVPTALVFGGEAAGLSATVLAGCSVSVHIPIARPERPGHHGHAESLNLAAAVAVMAYAVHDAQQHATAHTET
ncbi:TrmH family RNA methyltransferase [Euzebya sp.]|uniref:TrmH family RNA methyltransferase n=1 Tax=Euzebya sp. TaxID=1971409 RepID=UPI0035124A61